MKVLLFSGGLDSTALAHMYRPDQLLFMDYGQVSAAGELRAAAQIARDLDLPFDARNVDCRSFGAGHLVGSTPLSEAAPEFWPFRNQLLITLAAMAYFTSAPLTILIGTVASDSVHPDGSREFLENMERVLACQGGIHVQAPALELTSAELVRRSAVPRSTLAWSFSCHQGNTACGQCRGCHKQAETLAIQEGG